MTPGDMCGKRLLIVVLFGLLWTHQMQMIELDASCIQGRFPSWLRVRDCVNVRFWTCILHTIELV